MKFKVTQRIVLEFSLRKFFGIQPKVFDRLLQGNALRIPSIQELLIQPAHQRTTADEWGAEAYSFLLGKANHLNAETKPPSLQLFQQRDGKNNPQNAVVSTGVGNRIKVRAYQEAPRVRCRSRIPSPDVSRSIQLRMNTQRFHPSGNFPMAVTHRRRQESPARAVWIFSKTR